MSVAWKRGTRKRQLGHGGNASISYNKAFDPRVIVSLVIPSKCAFLERFESSREVVVLMGRSGSSCTRFVDELGVTVR